MRTKDIKTSGLKRRPVTVSPSCLSLDLRRPVSVVCSPHIHTRVHLRHLAVLARYALLKPIIANFHLDPVLYGWLPAHISQCNMVNYNITIYFLLFLTFILIVVIINPPFLSGYCFACQNIQYPLTQNTSSRGQGWIHI